MTLVLENRDLISIKDLNKEDIITILSKANDLKIKPKPHLLQGKILGSCFFEPSTRTRLSFESAITRLGGSFLGFSDSSSTSTKKGESLHDTMKMMENYADIIVIRHPLEGAAQWAAESCSKPVINAGDGANQHPTQTLLDLFSIQETHSHLDGLKIALVGDLKFGRTAHSLAQACSLFNTRLYFVSPEKLEMPKEICDQLRESGVKFSFHREIEEIIDRCDIIYMTRIQQERFSDHSEYDHLKKSFCLTADLLEAAKPSCRVLHPLPRVCEISPEVDKSSHAYYFQQAKNGLFVRQAILSLILCGDL